MNEYEKLKVEYEDGRKSLEPRIWLTARHAVTGLKFVVELVHLAELTGDVRFVVALEAVRDKNLVDVHRKLAFRKNTPHHVFAPAYKEWDDWAFVTVEEQLSAGAPACTLPALALPEICTLRQPVSTLR